MMKKIMAILAASAMSVSVLAMSGCDDFRFNPIGKWKLTDDIVYDEQSNELEHGTEEEMAFGGMTIVFEKSGNGYIEVDGYKTQEFTYLYSDKEVSIFPFASQSELPDETDADINPSVVYQVSKDGKQISSSNTQTFNTTDEGIITLTEKLVLTRQ